MTSAASCTVSGVAGERPIRPSRVCVTVLGVDRVVGDTDEGTSSVALKPTESDPERRNAVHQAAHSPSASVSMNGHVCRLPTRPSAVSGPTRRPSKLLSENARCTNLTVRAIGSS